MSAIIGPRVQQRWLAPDGIVTGARLLLIRAIPTWGPCTESREDAAISDPDRPEAAKTGTAVQPLPERPVPSPAASATATKRVLIVDDHGDGAEALALLLRLAGHEVQIVWDGASALGAIEARKPDFIVMDIALPDVDGYTLARRLRAGGCTAQLAAITGYGQPEDRRWAHEAGFDHYFVKPIDPLELEHLLGSNAARLTSH